MERLNISADEKISGSKSFTERIHLVLVSLVGCAFNEVHGLTIDVSNNNFGDNLWYPVPI